MGANVRDHSGLVLLELDSQIKSAGRLRKQSPAWPDDVRRSNGMSTVTIPLSHGKFTVIDAADAERVQGIEWYALHSNKGKWYAVARIEDRLTYLHRYLLNAPKTLVVDHIDGDGLNNRRANIRLCTVSQNGRNVRGFPNTTSKYKGVSWCKWTGRWAVHIKLNRKSRKVGRFDSEIEAAHAYDAAARELHGEFARLNFPEPHEQAA